MYIISKHVEVNKLWVCNFTETWFDVCSRFFQSEDEFMVLWVSTKMKSTQCGELKSVKWWKFFFLKNILILVLLMLMCCTRKCFAIMGREGVYLTWSLGCCWVNNWSEIIPRRWKRGRPSIEPMLDINHSYSYGKVTDVKKTCKNYEWKNKKLRNANRRNEVKHLCDSVNGCVICNVILCQGYCFKEWHQNRQELDWNWIVYFTNDLTILFFYLSNVIDEYTVINSESLYEYCILQGLDIAVTAANLNF